MATANFGIHLLSKSASGSEEIFPFGGGLRYVVTISRKHLQFKIRFWSVVIMAR